MTRRPPLLALAGVLVVAIVGCGGSSTPTQTGGSGVRATTGSASAAAQGQPVPGRPEQGGEAGKGGEASIEEFGSAAAGAERAAIHGAFKGYLTAIATGDSATACSYLAIELRQTLKQLAGKALAARGCAAALPKLLSPSAPIVARAQVRGRVTRVRVRGGRAFVVFHAPGARLYQMPLVTEGGKWKVASAVADVLVPELSGSG